MRYKERVDGKIPDSLDGEDSKGGKERKKAIDFFCIAGNKDISFEKYSAYKGKDVKEMLEKQFHFKCAYCESRYGNTQPMDVEHWRPKGRVKTATGNEIKPGYYWLAANWENLMPSCIDCNRRRGQFDAALGREVKIGKMDAFPLIDENDRCKTHKEKLAKEKPLLIHPREDDGLEDMFEFDADEAVIKPASGLNQSELIKVKTSIQVYALNRSGLVVSRKELLLRIKQKQHTILSLAKILETYPENENENDESKTPAILIEEIIHTEMKELASYMDTKHEYSLMAIKAILPFIAEMET